MSEVIAVGVEIINWATREHTVLGIFGFSNLMTPRQVAMYMARDPVQDVEVHALVLLDGEYRMGGSSVLDRGYELLCYDKLEFYWDCVDGVVDDWNDLEDPIHDPEPLSPEELARCLALPGFARHIAPSGAA